MIFQHAAVMPHAAFMQATGSREYRQVADPAQKGLSSTAPAASGPASIGTATMTKDGSIVMDLRASGPGIGDARLSYTPGSKHYDEVLRHLGGLNPGETKQVPPWPDKS